MLCPSHDASAVHYSAKLSRKLLGPLRRGGGGGVAGKEIQVAYTQVREVRTAPRAFGLWGDMVGPPGDSSPSRQTSFRLLQKLGANHV